MVDVFPNFAALKEEHQEGEDYAIMTREGVVGASAVIVAPHGGKIEAHTSQIARAVAGNDISFYLFEGLMRGNNRRLHITSENFDEPLAIDLVACKTIVVAIHGRENRGDLECVFMGGKDRALANEISRQLREAGFKTLDTGHRFPGMADTNICNRGLTGKGAQLELPRRLRDDLHDSPADLLRFAAAVRNAILR